MSTWPWPTPSPSPRSRPSSRSTSAARGTARTPAAEVRGVAGFYWSLRPMGGGTEWEVEPRYLRTPFPIERLRAR
ncbi:hypothetical protein ACFCX4_19970, partial [Kitasatospora sp. NPDC056327]|uniref:hypothetical protein n=1 Tax=Kitasatospora sp. NPDC056327 TaxID=3345785 RepID=UPI0035D53934